LEREGQQKGEAFCKVVDLSLFIFTQLYKHKHIFIGSMYLPDCLKMWMKVVKMK